MELFRDDNTSGYSKKELDDLNREWANRVKEQNLNEDTEEYADAEKRFSDEVSHR